MREGDWGSELGPPDPPKEIWKKKKYLNLKGYALKIH
jgi:hypothetical protein